MKKWELWSSSQVDPATRPCAATGPTTATTVRHRGVRRIGRGGHEFPSARSPWVSVPNVGGRVDGCANTNLPTSARLVTLVVAAEAEVCCVDDRFRAQSGGGRSCESRWASAYGRETAADRGAARISRPCPGLGEA
jgi:hypothetical protein